MTRKVLNGYYYTMVQYDAPLALMPYAQAGVRYFTEESPLNSEHYERTNVYQLVSYCTPILEYHTDTDELYIVFDPTYSASTRKHVGAFLKEYVKGVTYQQVRDAYHEWIKRGTENKYMVSAGPVMSTEYTMIIVQP